MRGLDEFYSSNLAQETLRGMRESTSRGSYITPVAPYGYKRVKVKDGNRERITLQPDPPTAPAVRRIFREALQGKGLKKICRTLNREGLLRPGGRPWTSSNLHYLLRNEVYTGTLVWGRSSRHGHPVQEVRVENTWEPLVDRETFEKVQELLSARSPKRVHPRRVASPYLLSGLLRCGRCGKAFIGQDAKNGEFRILRVRDPDEAGRRRL